MANVRLDIPETQVVALVRQLSPAARQAVLQMLMSELDDLPELDDLDDLEAFMDYDEASEFWETADVWDEEGGMNREQLLAAETFHYSYANYDNHLGIGNIRFDKLMPDDVDTLERAEQEDWDDARLAEALEVEQEHVARWRRSYQRAKSIVDAPTPAESFRHGVRFSIEDAVRDGLADEKQIEDLVTQICYRAADLAYLLDMGGERLSDYSRELRATSSSGFAPLISTDDTD
jgi:hypothetical protein